VRCGAVEGRLESGSPVIVGRRGMRRIGPFELLSAQHGPSVATAAARRVLTAKLGSRLLEPHDG